MFLAVTLTDTVEEVGETFVTGRAAQRIMLSLRIRIWAQLQRLSLDYYEREMAGRIMTRMTTDVDQFETLIENGLLSALVSFVTFAGVGVALVLFNVELGLLTLSVVIPLAIATAIFRRRSARLYDLARDRIAVVNADFQESLSGVREAQAFVHEASAIRRFKALGASYLEARVGAQRLVAMYFPFVLFLSAVADAIVLGVGAGLIHSGELTSGALIAFILYVDMFFSPIQQLSQVFDAWQQTRISVGRISDLMRLDTLTPHADEPVDAGRLIGAVALAGVHFSYPGTPAGVRDNEQLGPSDPRLLPGPDGGMLPPPEALRGIDLAVAPGETVALVGETGAGKSTVMKLLTRFYDPDSGAVTVDGNDLRALDLGAFRRQLGYVPQEAFLFTGTVRDNIAYGRHEATDAEVEAAARAVGAHDFVAALPGGYLHEISERGRSLSAGQRQLIALARAELVDPQILLLDEATSNLDLATEAQVTAAMQSLARGRTTVVIAHRLQTARTADRIVVLARWAGGRGWQSRRAAGGCRSLCLDVGGLRAARRRTRGRTGPVLRPAPVCGRCAPQGPTISRAASHLGARLVHHRPDLDGPERGERQFGGDLQGPLLALDVDDVVAREMLLRLEIGPVADRRLGIPHADHLGVGGVGQPERAEQLAGLEEPAVERVLVGDALAELFRAETRPELLVAVDHQEVLHGRHPRLAQERARRRTADSRTTMGGMMIAAASRCATARVIRVDSAVWLAASGRNSETATSASAVRRNVRAGRFAQRAVATASPVPSNMQKTTPNEKLAGEIATALLAPGSAACIGTPTAWAAAP